MGRCCHSRLVLGSHVNVDHRVSTSSHFVGRFHTKRRISDSRTTDDCEPDKIESRRNGKADWVVETNKWWLFWSFPLRGLLTWIPSKSEIFVDRVLHVWFDAINQVNGFRSMTFIVHKHQTLRSTGSPIKIRMEEINSFALCTGAVCEKTFDLSLATSSPVQLNDNLLNLWLGTPQIQYCFVTSYNTC